MSDPPNLIQIEDFPGDDFLTRWPTFIEHVYQRYLKTVAFGNLRFRGLNVSCQFRPETDGKHFAFWHMMQEGSGGVPKMIAHQIPIGADE